MAQGRTLTYFISDLHIGAGYIGDTHDHERRLVAWLDSIAPTAKAIYLLGDVLDYWYEYRTVVPRGYVRFFGALARLADSGVEIIWLKGNHDIWIFDYLPREIGLTVHDGILQCDIDGRRFVMEHGDGVGELRRSYRLLRKVFRCRFAQWLYAAIHPRWTVGFAHRWSRHSRLHGSPEPVEQLNSDDPLVKFAVGYEASHGPVDYFVFGHRHVTADYTLPSGARLFILGDGFRLMTYGVFDGLTFSLRSMETGEPSIV